MSKVTLRRDELVAEATRHMAANTQLTEFGDRPHLMADFAMMIAARVAVRMTPPPELATLRASLAAVIADRDRIITEVKDCAKTLAAYTRDLEVISGHTRRLAGQLAAAKEREGRLREALENIAGGLVECVGRYQEDAMQNYARAALKDPAP